MVDRGLDFMEVGSAGYCYMELSGKTPWRMEPLSPDLNDEESAIQNWAFVSE